VTVLEHRYAPLGSCFEVLKRRDPEVLISGPAGTGKSRACLEKILGVCLKYPGARVLIVRKTATSLASSAMVTWRRDVATEFLLSGEVSFYSGSPQEPPSYRFRNGSVVVIGGMDKATRIMSTEYDLIYVQEATELIEDDWEALTTRLRNGVIPYQQLIADTNPAEPTHWLKQRTDVGKTAVLESRHEDNPILFQAGELTERGVDYISKLDALTGVRYLRLRKGQWVAAEGMIYDEFGPEHLVDELPEGSDKWTRYWSVDFGYTNPMVVQCWAEDPDGRLWLYREWYQTRRTTEQMCLDMESVLLYDEDVIENGKVVHRKGEWTEPEPYAIVCDHDAGERAVFETHFGSTRAAKKDVKPGIEAVQTRLKVAGDGRPRLFLVRNCVVRRDRDLLDRKKPSCTQDEIPGYVWSDKKQDTPVKEDDHGSDAMRYIVAEQDLQSRGNPVRGFF
jgi:PBSX family phage terminase large subunit